MDLTHKKKHPAASFWRLSQAIRALITQQGRTSATSSGRQQSQQHKPETSSNAALTESTPALREACSCCPRSSDYSDAIGSALSDKRSQPGEPVPQGLWRCRWAAISPACSSAPQVGTGPLLPSERPSCPRSFPASRRPDLPPPLHRAVQHL